MTNGKIVSTKPTVLITGSGIGIGRATALAFGKAGYHVVVTDVLEQEGRTVAADIASAGGSAEFHLLNVRSTPDVDRLVQDLIARFGALDCVVANAGTSYHFATAWPVEVGLTGRHVGDRYNTDANSVTLNAYTVADVYAFVDIPKSVFSAVDQTRLTFRVRNLTDKRYAIWGDPFYPDQVLLGAPRTYEISAAFKW